MNRLITAVLGSTGLVGQQFVRLLEHHPFFQLAALAASAKSQGLAYRQATDWAIGGTMPPEAADLRLAVTDPGWLAGQGVQVVFSALPGTIAGPVERECRRLGLAVFSNAGALRMEADIPLLVAEVNPGHLILAERQRKRHRGFIVAGPNCSTAGLVLALAPLASLAPLRSVVVTTEQAVSGAGRRGLGAWDILGTVVPLIEGEEEKMSRETEKILGPVDRAGVTSPPFALWPTCTRVPVREGHLECLDLEFSEPVSLDRARQALAGFTAPPQELRLPTAPLRPLVLHEGRDRPQPLRDVDAGGPGRGAGMAVTVGRLRQGSDPKRMQLVLLVHNTVRGAAGGCLLNAELALARGLLAGGTT